MAAVGNIVLYRPKEGRENDLLELVKKHWGAAHGAGLTTDDPARIWRATDRRTGKVTFVERFSWRDNEASTRAHHDPAVQAVWVPMDEVLEDMTILLIEEVEGHPPGKRAGRTTAAAPSRGKRAAPKRATKKSAGARRKMKSAKAPKRGMPAKRSAKRRAGGKRAKARKR